MTLHEIEETLRTLVIRHPGLDENTLVTLCRAGGWEEKSISEALSVFRSMNGHVAVQEEKRDMLPGTQEAPVFAPTPSPDHLLVAKNEEKKHEAPHNSVTAPESLVHAEPASMQKREDLPHNLPLRPFETSEHIWPFSRYRDVFYGDTEEPPRVVQKKQEQPAQETKAVPVPTPIVQEPPREESLPKIAAPQPPAKPRAPSGGDEKLVILASVMLLVILILLGYMYGNGRL